MKYKRLVCAVLALMLVGASVAGTAVVFADEPANIEVVGDNVGGGEDAEETTGEEEVVSDEEAVDITASETVGEEIAEPAVAPAAESAVLRAAAAPTANVLAANDEVLRDAGNEVAAAYDYTMELSNGTKALNIDGVHNSGNWRCSVVPANSGLTCDTEGTGSPWTGYVGGNVTATKPGEYTVKFEHKTGRQARWNVVSTATVAVYNLDVTAQENTILEPGDEFNYTINEANTFGDVEVTVTRDGEVIDATNSIDTSEEGEYVVSIINTSAAAAGYNESEEFYFYVIDPAYESMVVEQGEVIELNGSARWAADYVHGDPSGQDFEVDEESGIVLVDTSELGLGMHRFEVAHTFETGERETVNNVTVIIYKITPADTGDAEEDYQSSADTLKDLIEQYGEMEGEGDYIKLVTKIGEIFGATDEGAMAANMFGMGVLTGNEIVTRAYVEELAEDEVSEALLAKIAGLDVDSVSYYDVTVWMEIDWDGDVFPLGQIHQLDENITVAVVEVTDPEDGYTRTYYVVREHDGTIEVLTEGVDFYIKDGKLYIISDKFSTYAVAYRDTLIPAYGGVTYTVSAPDTGVNTKVDGGVTSANMVVAVLATLTATALAGVAMFAKRR